MIKKGGLFLFLFILLHAEYAVVLSSNGYKKLHILGANCVKYSSNKYFCYKSDDKCQLRRFVNFANQNGVNAKIVKLLSKNMINVYSIQIFSSISKEAAEKYYEKFKNLPFTRVEKIGKYYTLRIGASKNKSDMEKLLKKLHLKNAFVRIADIKINRIIVANFYTENKKLQKLFSKNNKNIFKLSKHLNISEKDLSVAGNLKKACNVYTILSLLKNNPKYHKLKNEACYKLHMNNLKKLHSDYDKINELNKAIKYKKTNEARLLLNYYKAKTFQSVNINFLNSLTPDVLSKNLYKKYLITLLYAGDIKRIKLSCKVKFIYLCKEIDNFLAYNTKKIINKDIKDFLLFIKKIDNVMNKRNFYQASEYIEMLKNINKKSVFAKIYELELFVRQKDLKNNNLISAKKEIMTLMNKYPNNFDVNILAGDIFYKLHSYRANFYYHKAYLMDKKRFFSHLLKIGNYKVLMNYVNSDLKKYPSILSKVYIYKANDYFKNNHINLALKNALKAYFLLPSANSSILLGKIYFSLGNYKNCIKYLNDFANNDRLKYYLGYSYLKLGNKKMAKKYFDEIFNTKDKKLKRKLIAVYLKMGEEKKVEKLFKNF